MILNPELQRNIWKDFSLHRILIMALTIFLILWVFALGTNLPARADAAFYLACFFIFIWGTKNASETVIEEVNNSTWDFQRQTAMSPWTMTWGKLFGSTLYSWYGAFICLGVYALYALYSPNPTTKFYEIGILILGGIFTHATTILLSLQLLPHIRREKTNKTFRYFLGGITLGYLFTHPALLAIHGSGQMISWYGYSFDQSHFTLVSLCLFLGWAILGLYRSFAKELQYQNSPWAWAIFNLYCLIYFSGFINIQNIEPIKLLTSQFADFQQNVLNAPYYLAFFIAIILTYAALFIDELTLLRYRKLVQRSKVSFRESLQQLPWWPISFTFTLIMGLAIVLRLQSNNAIIINYSPFMLVFTTCGFLLRDILLIHFFNFGQHPRKALGASLLYLFILYTLLPLLLQALQFSALLPLFVPSWGQNTPLALFSLFIQIGLLSALCWRRILSQQTIIKA